MRLRKVGAVRLGRFAALAVGVVAAALAIGLRSIDGSTASVEGFVVGAARWSAWLGAGSVALGAANRRASIDRRDGLEILALARGASTRSLAAARVAATSLVATRAVLVPSLLVAFIALASAGTGRVAATRAMLILVVAAFATIVGVTLGSLATLADRLRPSGGRGLFLALVIAPWAALDLIGRGAFSIPGALGSVLSLGLDAIGLGRLV